MQLEDYFDFRTSEDGEEIRIKGSRVGIEVVIGEFNQGVPPAQIQQSYPTVTLEQVYATITYYLHNRKEVDAYIQRGREAAEAAYREHLQRQPPSPLAER